MQLREARFHYFKSQARDPGVTADAQLYRSAPS